MTGGIQVKEFKWIKGENDLEYIHLLEEHRKIDKRIISKAIANLKELTQENKRLKDEISKRK